MVLGTLFVVLSVVFGIFIAPMVRIALDEAGEILKNTGGSVDGLTAKKLGFLSLKFGGIILAAALIKGYFMYQMRQKLIVMSRRMEFDMKNDLFAKMQSLSFSFYKQSSTGDMMSRLSEDISRVRMFLGPAVMYTINMAATFILVISVMFSINVKLTLYVLLPLPLLSYLIYHVSNIINRKSDELQASLSDITTFAQQAFSGIRVIKSFAAEHFSIEEMKKEAAAYRQKALSLALTDSLFFPLMMMLIGLSTILTIYIGGMEVIGGNLTYGNIAEYIIYVNLLTWPVASLGWVSSIIQRAAASQERINEIMRQQPDFDENAGEKIVFSDSLEFQNVSFDYPETKKRALKSIHFTLKRGETLAILGATGSGKSTIAYLLMRLFDPSEGKILIDGKDLKNLSRKAFLNQVGYVPQDVFLFSDTIANNIRFGNTQPIIDRELLNLARLAVMDKEIEQLNKGFDTMLGERGISLSGGQKQRVAIARALCRQPEILILDDCLSAVDTHTEAKLLSNFREILADKTAIIISHRVSSVAGADQILVLEEGRIAERGNHQSLMELDGIYRKLYLKQAKEPEYA